MAKRKTAEAPSDEPGTMGEAGQQVVDGATDFDPAKLEQQPAEAEQGAEQPKKKWTPTPDPYPTHGVFWPDRYGIHYQESRGSQRGYQAQIRFGEGGQDDMPKNFDEIKPFLKENGLSWNKEDRAWGKNMRNQFDRAVRDEVQDLLPQIVELEEKVRGPHSSKTEPSRGRGA